MDEKAREGERAREMCDTSSVSVGHVDTFCRLAADAEQETVDRFDETHTARMKTVLSLTQIRVTLTARSSLAPPTTLHTTLTTTTPHDPHHHHHHSTRPSPPPPTLHTTLTTTTTNTPHDPHHHQHSTRPSPPTLHTTLTIPSLSVSLLIDIMLIMYS